MFPTAKARYNQLVWNFKWDGSQLLEKMIYGTNDTTQSQGEIRQLLKRTRPHEDSSDDDAPNKRNSVSSSQNTGSLVSSTQSYQSLIGVDSISLNTLKTDSREVFGNLFDGMYKPAAHTKSSSDPALWRQFEPAKQSRIVQERSLSNDDLQNYCGSKDLDFESFFMSVDPISKPPDSQHTSVELTQLELEEFSPAKKKGSISLKQSDEMLLDFSDQIPDLNFDSSNSKQKGEPSTKESAGINLDDLFGNEPLENNQTKS